MDLWLPSNGMQTNEFNLGAEGARYVTESLDLGRSLSHELLHLFDIEKGQTFCLLAAPVTKEAAVQFDTGGKLVSQPPIPLSSADGIKTGLKISRIPDSDPELARLIHKFLQLDPGHVCLFEDSLRRSFDPFEDLIGCHVKGNSDEVYHLLFSTSNETEILEIIRKAKAPLHIGLLASVSPEQVDLLKSSDEFNDFQLKDIARSTRTIVVGAYDLEGYVVWNRVS
ncbi:hypothetical protein [Pedosphaera parvula]|uniref:Uncharacterized protein n=1 Tax=Pedosphaera parvula (strain Ellin514) TaxID=320771 RepID=B9XRY6_PEDPL|nr:hypothetical protein [Pedosphaera parvula]EEF57397.1 hypothetical protein Cflav_PD0370 [Pedosphaera parvula Ellin514]